MELGLGVVGRCACCQGQAPLRRMTVVGSGAYPSLVCPPCARDFARRDAADHRLALAG